MRRLWGIDLGGTKIEGVIIEPSGSVLGRLRIDTEQHRGYEHILHRIGLLIEALKKESGQPSPTRIGLAMPGNLDAGVVKNANTTCLIGKPLVENLQALLGVEIVAENDANCFALAEASMGAARGAQVVFGIILGTGVGGGLIVGNKLLPGHHGIAGEWGHNLLIPDGESCYCGKRGCVETVISGPALERFYAARTGVPRTMREIASREEPAAQATRDRLCDYFGRALASVVNTLDPDVIVVGGGVGNVDDLYSRGRDSLAKWIFNPRFDAVLTKPALGDSAGVFGAALLSQS